MELPRKNHQLNEIFETAKVPEISEFNGEYAVDVLTVLPSLRKLSHRKFFLYEKQQHSRL